MHGVLLGVLALYALLTFPAGFAIAFGEGGGSPVFQDFLYVVGSWVGTLVLLAFVGGLADGLRRAGTPRVTAPLVLAVLGLLALLLAEGLNAARVVDNIDLTGTTADIGVAHLAWAAGLLGVLAALHHWSTKVFGFVLKDGLGYLAGLAVLGGAVVTGAAHFVAALQISSLGDDTREALNGIVALIGWGLVALGVLVFLVNLAGSAAASRSGDAAPDDPWDGLTLEWATASPPVPGGPGPLEPVTSPTPLLDTKGAVTS
jgi:heme/copper-type cytochrome/quinol oxidase subunit 1